MKKMCLLFIVAALLSVTAYTRAASMAIDSLYGPVTANEINSFITFMNTQTPPQTPWGALNGTNGSHNVWANATGGRDVEAMGMMYEASGNIAILNQMVRWVDICVSQRNDLMSAANGGQRVMWDTNIDMVWCPNEPTDPHAKYAGSENVDTESHIVYCAKLILQNPSLWNTTVPDGNPHGYGVTYLDRAKTYVAKCDEANDEYSLKWFIQKSTNRIRPPTLDGWTTIGENVTANNRQMMFNGGFQRLAECHELLGDSPSRVAQYDAIVKASTTEVLNGMINFPGNPRSAKGQTVYKWGYFPDSTADVESTEIHAEYDMIGVWRAFNRPAYGLTLAPLVPFANTMVDAIYLGPYSFALNVDGSGGPHSGIDSGWDLIADWNPQEYITVAGSSYTNGWYKTSPDIDAGILFMKNRRYLEFAVNASPSSQTIVAGSSTSFTTMLTPLGGFRGSVAMSVSALPSGATATFSSPNVNLATINTATTNLMLTISTTASTAAGTYTVTVTGTSGSVSHSTTVTLTITPGSDFTISATPSSESVVEGNNATYTVNIGSLNGFNGAVGLSASGLPAGTTASFNPASVTGTGSSTLTITTTTSTPMGSYTITITGASGSLSHSTTVTLTVTAPPDFTISASPSSQTITAGNGTSYTATVSALNGFSGSVSLSVSGLPSGASGSFSPASVTGSGSSTLSVVTTTGTAAGTYTLTITGTSGSLSHSIPVTLTVNPVATTSWTTVNDTDPSVTYSTDWGYSTNRNLGDYNNDVHFVRTNGNYAQFTFTGTGVQYITEANTDEGNVDIYIDGVLQTTVSCNAASRQTQFVAYQNTGLAAGTHTIKAVKNGGTYMLLDAFAYTTAFNATGIYKLQNEASGLVLNNQGSLTNGSAITQWSATSTSSNLDWTFIPTSNGYYQINSVKSGLDAAVQSASTSAGAGIIQWSFGSSGNDQWKPTLNSDGSYTFVNLHSGLVLEDPGSSTSTSTQMDQWTATGGSNQKWMLLPQ